MWCSLRSCRKLKIESHWHKTDFVWSSHILIPTTVQVKWDIIMYNLLFNLYDQVTNILTSYKEMKWFISFVFYFVTTLNVLSISTYQFFSKRCLLYFGYAGIDVMFGVAFLPWRQVEDVLQRCREEFKDVGFLPLCWFLPLGYPVHIFHQLFHHLPAETSKKHWCHFHHTLPRHHGL